MRCFSGALFLTLLLFNSAWAGNPSLVGTNVAWSPIAGASPIFYASIVNKQHVTESLSGWQLRLKIIPEGDATGVLQFNSADLPRELSENYLLYGDSFGLTEPVPPPFDPLVDTILLKDFAAVSWFGSVIPSSERSLLKADFFASEDAEGIFAIAAVPGADSFWSHMDIDFSITQREYYYGDLPTSGGYPVIGYVTVTQVPEPYGLLLLLTASITWTFGCRVIRIRGKQ